MQFMLFFRLILLSKDLDSNDHLVSSWFYRCLRRANTATRMITPFKIC